MSKPLRRFISFGLLATLALSSALTAQTAPSTPAQAPAAVSPKDDPELQHALDFYRAGKFVDAMPLLETLAAEHPSDGAIKAHLAFCVMAYAATLADPELRVKARVRARNIALQAKELGSTDGLLTVVLDLPADGSQPPFSDRTEVDAIMKAAEAEFVRGDFDKAREGYVHALLLDPKNYEAALFIGDVYFKQHINGSAGEWFARAVEIDPNRETAYRYWGDALWDLGKGAEARGKYIQAIIADPYSQRSWVGMTRWTDHTGLKLNWVRLQDKSEVTQKDEENINITLDSSFGKDDPNSTAWLTYSLGRASWHGDKFKKEFPNEPKYRRTMREEADSLHLMVTVMLEQKNFEKKKNKLDPALLQLVQIDHAGFIEPFVLLNRADKEIAQDYAPYRAAHRDLLYRYFDEFVVPKAPAQ
jgi:tetratricopeptide (TPR) repeat protein